MQPLKLVFLGKSRVPTAQGKQGKWPKKIPVMENTGNLAKTQGILFAQVVNYLILKVKDIVIFAVKISSIFQKLCKFSCVYVIVTNYENWHRENTGNLKMQLEWVPCKREIICFYVINMQYFQKGTGIYF